MNTFHYYLMLLAVLVALFVTGCDGWTEMNITIAEPNHDHWDKRFHYLSLENAPPITSKVDYVSIVHLVRLLGILLMCVNQIWIQMLWIRLYTEEGQQQDYDDFLEETNEGFILTDHAEEIKQKVMENLDNEQGDQGGNTVIDVVQTSVYEQAPTIRIVQPRRKQTAASAQRSTEKAGAEEKKPKPAKKKSEKEKPQSPNMKRADPSSPVDQPQKHPSIIEVSGIADPDFKNDNNAVDTQQTHGEDSKTAEGGEFVTQPSEKEKNEKKKTELLQRSNRLPRAPKGHQSKLLENMEEMCDDEQLEKELEEDRKMYDNKDNKK